MIIGKGFEEDMNKNTEYMNVYAKARRFQTQPLQDCYSCELYYLNMCDGISAYTDNGTEIKCNKYKPAKIANIEAKVKELDEELDNLTKWIEGKNKSDNRYFLADCLWNIAVGTFIALHLLGYV